MLHRACTGGWNNDMHRHQHCKILTSCQERGGGYFKGIAQHALHQLGKSVCKQQAPHTARVIAKPPARSHAGPELRPHVHGHMRRCRPTCGCGYALSHAFALPPKQHRLCTHFKKVTLHAFCQPVAHDKSPQQVNCSPHLYVTLSLSPHPDIPPDTHTHKHVWNTLAHCQTVCRPTLCHMPLANPSQANQQHKSRTRLAKLGVEPAVNVFRESGSQPITPNIKGTHSTPA